MKLRHRPHSLAAILLAAALLWPSVPVRADDEAAATDAQVQSYEEKLAASKAKQEELSNELFEIHEQKENAQQEMQKIDELINNMNQQKQLVEGQLESIEMQIESKKQSIEDLTARVEAQESAFYSRMLDNYMEKETDYVELILGAASLKDFLTKVDYVTSILKSDRSIIRQLEADKEQLASDTALLEKAEEDKVAQVSVLSEAIQNRQLLYNSKEELVESLNEDESLRYAEYEYARTSAAEAQDNIARRLNEINEEAIRREAAEAAARKAAEEEAARKAWEAAEQERIAREAAAEVERQRQEAAAAEAAAQAERERQEAEAARIAAEQEAARKAQEAEAARIAAEQAAAQEEEARKAAEAEAARLAAEAEEAKRAAEQAAAEEWAAQQAAEEAARQEAASNQWTIAAPAEESWSEENAWSESAGADTTGTTQGDRWNNTTGQSGGGVVYYDDPYEDEYTGSSGSGSSSGGAKPYTWAPGDSYDSSYTADGTDAWSNFSYVQSYKDNYEEIDSISDRVSFPLDVSPENYMVTSEVGWRELYGQDDYHMGIDLSCDAGTPILAYKGGKVLISEYHYSYGNYVLIYHGDGLSTLYAHMSERAVSVGDWVDAGDVIGYVGMTGSAYGYHLHFEVRQDNAVQDPRNYMYFKAYME